MMLLMALAVLCLAAIVGTVCVVLRDGYGQRPVGSHRGGRTLRGGDSGA